MSRRQAVVVALAAFLGGCVASQVTRVAEAKAEAYTGQRWQYSKVAGFAISEDDLNPLGAQGWELVGCAGQNGNICFLKRPLR